jgi:hypothetical protein
MAAAAEVELAEPPLWPSPAWRALDPCPGQSDVTVTPWTRRHGIAASLRRHPSRSTACLTTLHEPWETCNDSATQPTDREPAERGHGRPVRSKRDAGRADPRIADCEAASRCPSGKSRRRSREGLLVHILGVDGKPDKDAFYGSATARTTPSSKAGNRAALVWPLTSVDAAKRNQRHAPCAPISTPVRAREALGWNAESAPTEYGAGYASEHGHPSMLRCPCSKKRAYRESSHGRCYKQHTPHICRDRAGRR